MTFLDAVATPNLISISFSKKIGVRAKAAKREFTVENGDKVNFKEAVKDVPVGFFNVTTATESLAVDEVPVKLLNGVSEPERLQTNLDLGAQFAKFKIGGREVREALQPQTSSFDEREGNSGNEYFTTDSSSIHEEVSGTKSSDEGEMVVSVAKECETECKNQADQKVNSVKLQIDKTKLSHFQNNIVEEECPDLVDSGILKWILNDPRLNVPNHHFVELKNNRLI